MWKRWRTTAVAVVAATGVACASGNDSSAHAPSVPDIAVVTYDQSRGPLGEGTGGERTLDDAHRIAELAELLGQYGTLDTPTRPESTIACVWATITTVRYTTVDGNAHELMASSCDPTPFEADLGALVVGWIAEPVR